MSSVLTASHYINGVFEEAGDATATVDVVSPGTGRVVRRVHVGNSSDVDRAVVAAKAAFEGWSGITIKQRAAIMFKLHALIERDQQELAELIMLENGKNITEALADVAKGNETVEWSCSLPQIAQGKVLEVSRGITCQDARVPLGVVGCIVPFNFPVMVPLWTIPISLAMGNCVICKPSEKVPGGMMKIAALMAEAGVPAGVFQIVNGTVEVVTSICDHPGISAVTFVGSSKVAKIVSDRCHALNKRVLALGGAKNHLIALPDCDVGMASRDIVASFAGCCGQRCMAASVLVTVGDCKNLVDEIVRVASALQRGQAAGQVGALIDNIAKTRVMSYINESEAGGAQILLDGRSWATAPDGFWMGPTIIKHSNPRDKAVLDEIFGPVLSIVEVDTWQEAIDIENANPYGNAACIYTEKGANAEWFINRFRAAMLGVNIGIPVPRGEQIDILILDL